MCPATSLARTSFLAQIFILSKIALKWNAGSRKPWCGSDTTPTATALAASLQRIRSHFIGPRLDSAVHRPRRRKGIQRLEVDQTTHASPSGHHHHANAAHLHLHFSPPCTSMPRQIIVSTRPTCTTADSTQVTGTLAATLHGRAMTSETSTLLALAHHLAPTAGRPCQQLLHQSPRLLHSTMARLRITTVMLPTIGRQAIGLDPLIGTSPIIDCSNCCTSTQ